MSPEAPVRFVDVGCGFGGLLTRLAVLYPDRRMVGFELRDKVRRVQVRRVPDYPSLALCEGHVDCTEKSFCCSRFTAEMLATPGLTVSAAAVGVGICQGTHPSPSTGKSRSIYEHCLCPNQCNEVSTKLLSKGAAGKDLFPLSGSTL